MGQHVPAKGVNEGRIRILCDVESLHSDDNVYILSVTLGESPREYDVGEYDTIGQAIDAAVKWARGRGLVIPSLVGLVYFDWERKED